MKVYVETNFVLELALEQAQHERLSYIEGHLAANRGTS